MRSILKKAIPKIPWESRRTQENIKLGENFIVSSGKGCVFGTNPEDKNSGYPALTSAEKGYYQSIALAEGEKLGLPNAAFGIKMDKDGFPFVVNLTPAKAAKLEVKYTYYYLKNKTRNKKSHRLTIPSAYNTRNNDPKNGGYRLGRGGNAEERL